MSDALAVAERWLAKAETQGMKDYWTMIVEGIKRDRKTK